MSSNRVKDMTDGSPMKLILSFMLPLLLGLLFQQFYNMVDTMVVGKSLGVDALAGVGSTGSLNFLVLGMAIGICTGFAIPVAQKFGQRDFDGLRKFVGNMIWLGVISAAVLTAVTTVNCKTFLHWMNTPEDTFSYAYDYIFLIFLGIPATMLYNILSGIIRSLGDSKTPLFFLIFSSLLNVVLDLWFITGLHMGVAGAGLATILSQLISGILCLVYMISHFPMLHLRREDMIPDRRYLRKLLSMGLPMGLQYSITAIGSILLQTSVNGLGSAAMAAIAAATKVINLLACPIDALATTASTFAGQNIGAGKPDRVRDGVRDGAVLGISYCIIVVLVVRLWGTNLTALFLNPEDLRAAEEVIPLSQQYLMVNALFYIPLMFVNLLRFTIQGLGFSGLAVIAGVSEMIARGAFGIGLVPLLGYDAACYASPAAWVMADLFLFPACFWCLKKQGATFGKRRFSLPVLPKKR